MAKVNLLYPGPLTYPLPEIAGLIEGLIHRWFPLLKPNLTLGGYVKGGQVEFSHKKIAVEITR